MSAGHWVIVTAGTLVVAQGHCFCPDPDGSHSVKSKNEE